jgi:hypothetical protein
MANNPFWDAAEDSFRNQRVCVHTDDGAYTGLLQLFNYNDRAVLLRDVTTPSGDTTPTALVRNPRAIEHDRETIDRETVTVPVEDIVPQPYSVRDFDDPGFAAFVRRLRRDGTLANLPLVRPLNDHHDAAYQIVSGHKRLQALRRADIHRHPVVVEPFSHWEATARFIDEHFPLTDTERQNCSTSRSGWYPPASMCASFQHLREDWDRDVLFAHPAIQANQAILESADGTAEDVHVVLTRATTISDDDDDEDDDPDADTGHDSLDVDEVVTDLATETGTDEQFIRHDLVSLRDYDVPLETATRALRRKYTDQ